MTDADLIDALKRILNALGDLAEARTTVEQLLASVLATADTRSDEDRIRDAMTEAHNHPGRTITR